MNVALYIRVSTEEQAEEGYSISGQLNRLKSFCLSQNWTVEEIYIDDGISAKNMKRPQLQKMLDDVKEKKFNCILVWDLDRLTRSVFDLYKILEILEHHNCKFKSATEVFDTTSAVGRMFVTMVATVAQWERENTGERISLGLEEKARQGKCPFNFSPIGYDLNKEESKLYINEREAVTIREIFNKYLEGLGSNRLVRHLNNNKYLTKKGGKWSSDTLFKVLKSPIHAGGIRWKGKIYWNTHDPIVSRDDWEEAQRLMVKRKTQPPRSVSSDYIFSRMIPCPHCNQNLTGTGTNTYKKDGTKVVYRYYRCANHKVDKCTYKNVISQNALEKEFLSYLKRVDFSDFAKEEATNNSTNKSVKIDYDALENELKLLEERKKKWQYAWTEEIISNDDFKKRMKEANAEENRITELLMDREEEEGVEIEWEQIENILKDIDKNWNNMKVLDKKNLLSDIIKSIFVERHEGKLYINSIVFL